MKIVITGGSGFIGTALTNRLKSEGSDVVSMPTEILLNKDSAKGFIRNESPDKIYHLAAYGNHYNQTDRYKTIMDNITAITNLLEAIKHIHVKECVNFSSSSVALPVQTFYSAAKTASDFICQAYQSEYNIPVRTVYPYSVFGPGEAPHRFIPTVIRNLLSETTMELDVDAVHDWIYIDNFINALLDGETYIGTGFSTSNLEIVRHLEMISDRRLSYVSKRLRPYDNTDWKAETGVTHLNLYTALKETYEYYVQQRA